MEKFEKGKEVRFIAATQPIDSTDESKTAENLSNSHIFQSELYNHKCSFKNWENIKEALLALKSIKPGLQM